MAKFLCKMIGGDEEFRIVDTDDFLTKENLCQKMTEAFKDTTLTKDTVRRILFYVDFATYTKDFEFMEKVSLLIFRLFYLNEDEV